MIRLARIGRPFGVRGEVHLQIFTDRPGEVLSAPGEYHFEDGGSVRVAELIHRGDKWMWRLELPESANGPHDGRLFVTRFTNQVVVADEAALPEREEGLSEAELRACEVFSESGERLGTFARFETRGGADAWILVDEKGDEAEFAAVDSIVKSVDIDARRIVIDREFLVK